MAKMDWRAATAAERMLQEEAHHIAIKPFALEEGLRSKNPRVRRAAELLARVEARRSAASGR